MKHTSTFKSETKVKELKNRSQQPPSEKQMGVVNRITRKGPFTRAFFCCYFLLLIDVNEWIDDECAECVLPHLNIRDWFTRSHLSGENRWA
jgi:hypothetical protein